MQHNQAPFWTAWPPEFVPTSPLAAAPITKVGQKLRVRFIPDIWNDFLSMWSFVTKFTVANVYVLNVDLLLRVWPVKLEVLVLTGKVALLLHEGIWADYKCMTICLSLTSELLAGDELHTSAVFLLGIDRTTFITILLHPLSTSLGRRSAGWMFWWSKKLPAPAGYYDKSSLHFLHNVKCFVSLHARIWYIERLLTSVQYWGLSYKCTRRLPFVPASHTWPESNALPQVTQHYTPMPNIIMRAMTAHNMLAD